MRRFLVITLMVLLASGGLIGASYLIAKGVCLHQLARTGDDLDWLRREFHLSDAELKRVRQLHEGYLPQCREMCGRIAVSNQELQTLLAASGGVASEAEKKLAEVALLRAQCQAQMLRHFQEVSQAMPPEQGRRYLAEMRRLTLGFHDQFEQGMSGSSPSAHGHR